MGTELATREDEEVLAQACCIVEEAAGKVLDFDLLFGPEEEEETTTDSHEAENVQEAIHTVVAFAEFSPAGVVMGFCVC
jgi:hypothetical protein